MPTSPTIKRHNHRIHPCPSDLKGELLRKLLVTHSDKSICIISAEEMSDFVLPDEVAIVHDAALGQTSYELIISYDLPLEADTYMKRLALTSNQAIILLDSDEKQALYSIEKLLGRTIIQEDVAGFSPQSNVKSERVRREEREKRIADGTLRDNRPDRIREKKFADKKKPGENRKDSRYEGRDGDGKPKFSGKTGDRNHRHDCSPRSTSNKKPYAKKPYNVSTSETPKRTPRKINVKAIKPTEVPSDITKDT